MTITSLDNIVRSALADRGYPMHYYLKYLTYGVNILRELGFDVMQNVKSVRLPVNSYKAVTLPVDFVDYVRVGNQIGQYVYQWHEKEGMNRLNNFDSSGNKIPYTNVESSNGLLPNNWEGFWYTNYVNDKGEHTGKMFNNIPSFPESFILVRERNEIQLDTGASVKEIVLDYISDGMTLTASNQVHPYAIQTIKAYIFWQHKEHGRQYSPTERSMAKDEYYNQLRILRGRMNSIDVGDIVRSLRKGYHASIKN